MESRRDLFNSRSGHPKQLIVRRKFQNPGGHVSWAAATATQRWNTKPTCGQGTARRKDEYVAHATHLVLGEPWPLCLRVHHKGSRHVYPSPSIARGANSDCKTGAALTHSLSAHRTSTNCSQPEVCSRCRGKPLKVVNNGHHWLVCKEGGRFESRCEQPLRRRCISGEKGWGLSPVASTR